MNEKNSVTVLAANDEASLNDFWKNQDRLRGLGEVPRAGGRRIELIQRRAPVSTQLGPAGSRKCRSGKNQAKADGQQSNASAIIPRFK